MKPAFVLLLAAACATVSPPPPPAPAPLSPPDPDAELAREVDLLREQARLLVQAQGELYWRSWVEGDAADLAATYAGHDDLFSGESVEKVERLRARTTDADRALALSRFRLYLAGEVVSREVAPAADAAASLVASAIVAVDGQEIPFRDLDARLAQEGHVGRRRNLWRAATPLVKKIAALLADRDRRTRTALERLGWTGPLAYSAELREVDPARLARFADLFLKFTEAPYRAAADGLARRLLGVGLADVRRSDVPRLFRSGEVDLFFAKERMVPAFEESLARVGLPPSSLAGLKIDAEPKARKNPRAIAIAVEVPGDVRLSVKPAAGLAIWAQLFHEAGHALAASLNRSGEWELQQLPNNAVVEAFGSLFEGLLDDPRFAAWLGVPAAKLPSLQRAGALRRLFLMRRAAGQLLFDLERLEGRLAQPAQAWRETMGRALGFPLDEEDGERWLLEQEELLLSADQFLGLAGAQLLAAHLDRATSAPWWSDPKAGARIVQLLAEVGRLTPDGLLSAIGASGDDPVEAAAALLAAIASKPAGAERRP